MATAAHSVGCTQAVVSRILQSLGPDGGSLIRAMAVNKMWRHTGAEQLTSFWELLLASLASPIRDVEEVRNIVSVYSVGGGPLQDIAFISSQLGFLDTGADQPFPVNLKNVYGLYHDLAFGQHLSQLLNANQPSHLIRDHDQHGNRVPQFVPFVVRYTDAHQPFNAQRLARLMGADAVIQQELVTRTFQPDRTDAAFLHWLSNDPIQAHTWNKFVHAAQHLDDYIQGAFEVRMTVENDARRSLVQPAMIMWVGVSSTGNALGMMTEEFHTVPGWSPGSNSNEFPVGSGPTGVTTQGSASSDIDR